MPRAVPMHLSRSTTAAALSLPRAAVGSLAIRKFEADYAAKSVWLTENYSSTVHTIAAANTVIAPAAHRMKAGHDITVNRARAKAMPGVAWAALDPVAQGRVSLFDAGGDAGQAVAALDELVRLSRLDPDWSWRRRAVIARDRRRLESGYTQAVLSLPPPDAAKSQDFLPNTILRRARSAAFIVMQRRPSSRKTVKASRRCDPLLANLLTRFG